VNRADIDRLFTFGAMAGILAGSVTPRNKTWRDAREAEGAPLLREYRVKSLIEGSNPSLSANTKALIRQGFFVSMTDILASLDQAGRA
jgi:hypothetical protein